MFTQCLIVILADIGYEYMNNYLRKSVILIKRLIEVLAATHICKTRAMTLYCNFKNLTYTMEVSWFH